MKKAAVLLLLALMMTACSGGTDESNSGQTAAPTTAAQPSETAKAGTPQSSTSQPPIPSAQVAVVKEEPVAESAKPAATGPAPGILVPLKKIDFGVQRQDKSIIRNLVVKNNGKADLKIESVVPSCGCTAVDFPKVIAPGKSGNIKIKLDTGKSPGQHTKSVTIKSNDPDQPSLQIDLVINVK